MRQEEKRIPINFRPDQLADVIDHETTDALLAQETRLQKLAYWLMKVQEETL